MSSITYQPVGKNTPSEPEEVASMYDKWSKDYEEDTYVKWKYTVPEYISKFLRPRCNPSDVVLDAGCGCGAFAATLKDLNLTNVTGIDVSKDMLAKAATRNFYTALHQLNFAEPLEVLHDNYFDIVICLGVTAYLNREMPFLEEFIRVTKPNGHIVITYRDDRYEQDNWEETFNELMEKQLLKKVEEKTHLPYLPGCEDYKSDITFRYLAFQKL